LKKKLKMELKKNGKLAKKIGSKNIESRRVTRVAGPKTNERHRSSNHGS